MSSNSASARPSRATPSLATIVDRISHSLPAQGPISVFIHHNPLHAYEHLPFEEAVVLAGKELGCEPFLSEARYRGAAAQGRITAEDVEAILRMELGAGGEMTVAGIITRLALRRRVALHGIVDARGSALSWLLGETTVLERFRDDLPEDVREQVLGARGSESTAGTDEAYLVGALWQACLAAVGRLPHTPAEPPALVRRPRDVLLAARGIDTDSWIHPVFIRFVAAYLDQGLSRWSMPRRQRGLYGCFVDIYGSRLAGFCGDWAGALPSLVLADRSRRRRSLESLEHSLRDLGVPEGDWEAYLRAEALALRGWAGMVRQFEERPDRVPAQEIPGSLADFLAVRLLLTRAALIFAARRHANLKQAFAGDSRSLAAECEEPTTTERAWLLFQAAQLCGLGAAEVERLSKAAVAELERELASFDGIARRRVLQQAYERHLRHRFYDALAMHSAPARSAAPAFQAVFCIDEREESFRRHLEEAAPEVETFGAPGFFGVAMHFRGTRDAHSRPLCPVAIQPLHYVTETIDAPGLRSRGGELYERAAGRLGTKLHVGSRNLVFGTVLTATIGVLWVIPLVLGVLFPWLGQHLSRRARAAMHPKTRLALERRDGKPPIGRHYGYTVEEMSEIVHGQLTGMGLVENLARLVFVIGHGSTSLNNPHESAHDCGACGGGHGGPNARAFAEMANDPRVRARLAARGLSVPGETWFIGAERNSANNALVFYDADRVPAPLKDAFERAAATFEQVREREAPERCRRFAEFPAWLPPRAALLHVEARAADLAQPRPEYGHATNAFCVVGRRQRTRGLFLDRRAFLVSYDPTNDADGSVLARSLGAVVPVVAGINLEYYFGYVDPTGYGCGTKLPHNITALLGVMDGAASDLRAGLPWQMLEIHEPVRLSMVVEAPLERLLGVVKSNPALRRLIENRWIFLGCLDPEGGSLEDVNGGGVTAYTARQAPRDSAHDSLSFYRGKRGPLPFASVVPPARTGSS